MRSDHVVGLRDTLQLLELQRACRIHRRDYRGAAASVIPLHRLIDTLRDEPTSTAQHVRAAFAGIVARQVQLTVRDASFPTDELQRMQTSLTEADWQQACLLSSLSERAVCYELLHKPVSMLDPKAQVAASFVLLVARPGDAAKVLGAQSDYVDAARGEFTALMGAYQAIDSRTQALAAERSGNPTKERRAVTAATALFLYYGNHSPSPFLRAAALQRASIAVLAIERYRRERGQLPDHLDDLVPDYLAAVPADPCNGYPMRMVKRHGSYAVYGVGIDLADNVGDVEYRDDHAATDDGLFVLTPIAIESAGRP
jgi:hypothetical protein